MQRSLDGSLKPARPPDELQLHNWAAWGTKAAVALTLIYAVLMVWGAGGSWPVALGGISLTELAIIITLVILSLLGRAGRFYYYTSQLGWKIPPQRCLLAFGASMALSLTPAKSGELLKFALLRRDYQVSMSEGMGIHLTERFWDLVSVVILAAGALFFFSNLRTYVLFVVMFILFMSFVGSQPRIHYMMLSLLSRTPRLKAFRQRAEAMLLGMRKLSNPRVLLLGGLISLLVWTLEAVAFCMIVWFLGLSISGLVGVSIYGLAVLAGALSMLPGGLGSFEIVMGILLHRFGVSSEIAILTIALFRICTIWLSTIIGVGFLLGWMAIPTRSVEGSKQDALGLRLPGK